MRHDSSSATDSVATYYTVVIPYTLVGATPWHPTEATGPFATFTRGAHPTRRAAVAWARHHLGATSYRVRRIAGGK